MAAQLWSCFYNPKVAAVATWQGKGAAVSTGPGEPVGVGDGVNAWGAIFSTKGTTVTASVSDVIYLGLIPEGAVILAGWLCGKSGATGTNVKIGLSAAGTYSLTGQANDAVLLASTALAARATTTFGAAGGLPYITPAIAAATYPKWYGVIATIAAGTMTVSLSFGVTLLYTTQGQGTT